MVAELIPHFLAEKAQLGRAEQPIDVEPRVGAADGLLDAACLMPSDLGGAGQAKIGPPRELAQRQPRHRIERPQKALHLVPRIARQPLVRPFAGQRHLVAGGVHLARQEQQGGAGRVDHRTLGGAGQLGVGVQHFGAAAIDDDRLGLQMPGHGGGFILFVQRRILN